jgi:hypothetical protein
VIAKFAHKKSGWELGLSKDLVWIDESSNKVSKSLQNVVEYDEVVHPL